MFTYVFDMTSKKHKNLFFFKSEKKTLKMYSQTPVLNKKRHSSDCGEIFLSIEGKSFREASDCTFIFGGS